MARNHASYRAMWMGIAEKIVVAERPDLAGRLVWDDLIFHFMAGRSAETAASRYLTTYAKPTVQGSTDEA